MKFHGNNILKVLDKTLGRLIVLVIGSLNLKKNNFNLNELTKRKKCKILIISINVMGDSLLLLPIINGLSKLEFIEISILSAPENFEIFKNWGMFKKIFIFKIKKFVSLIWKLNTEQFDIIIDTCQWIRLSSIISGLLKANFKIGFKSEKQYRHYVYDLAIPHINSNWEFFNYLKLFAFLPIEKININTELKGIDKNYKKKWGKYILIHPGAGNVRKSWNKYENLIKIIIEKTNFNIVLTGKRSEFEISIKHKRLINMQDKTDLLNLNQLVKDADVLICGNTGIMYMALFNKTKLITIPGPVSTTQWFWPGEQIEILSNIDCSPCVFFGFDYKCDKKICLDNVSVTAVFSALKEYIE